MVFEARRRHGNEWRSLTGAAIEPNCPNAQRSLLKGSSSDESARSSLRFEVREAYPPQVPSEIAGGSKCRGHGRAQEDQGEALAIGSGTLISGVSMPFHALFHPFSLCFLHLSSLGRDPFQHLPGDAHSARGPSRARTEHRSAPCDQRLTMMVLITSASPLVGMAILGPHRNQRNTMKYNEIHQKTSTKH